MVKDKEKKARKEEIKVLRRDEKGKKKKKIRMYSL